MKTPVSRRPQAHVFIKLQLPYLTKTFTPLSTLGTHTYNREAKKYDWLFPAHAMPAVRALTKGFLIPQDEAALVGAFATIRKRTVLQGPRKGAGLIEVVATPTDFLVTWQREGKPQTSWVPVQTAQALWRAILPQPRGTKVLTATVAKNYCAELGIVDFNVYEHGKFNWRYFFGHRTTYLRYWCALKVLQSLGLIEHEVHASKSGIIRLKDQWNLQTELVKHIDSTH